jgi:calcium-dependent protein kinase
VLGHGSFGSVKLAKHKINNQYVAIKIIEKSKLRGKESLLATEIYILQKLDHPNIIKFYEVYQDERFLYICMEYCEGGELLEFLGK